MWSRMAPRLIIDCFYRLPVDWRGWISRGFSVVQCGPGGLPPFRNSYVETTADPVVAYASRRDAIVAFARRVHSTAAGLGPHGRRRFASNAKLAKLFGLGCRKLALRLSAGYAVNGSMSRSAVNAAGAVSETPYSGR